MMIHKFLEKSSIQLYDTHNYNNPALLKDEDYILVKCPLSPIDKYTN